VEPDGIIHAAWELKRGPHVGLQIIGEGEIGPWLQLQMWHV
jgi:hypothetical protein